MEIEVIQGVKPKAEMGEREFNYTLEEFDRVDVQLECQCGSLSFHVYRVRGGYCTWIECCNCGMKKVVHDG